MSMEASPGYGSEELEGVHIHLSAESSICLEV